jgi:hypothetical protein
MLGNEKHHYYFCAFLAILLSLYFSWSISPETIYFNSDFALSLAVTQLGLGGDPILLGPPSHIGGRHLGPLYYYLLAFPQLAFGQDVYSIVVFQVVIKVIALIVSLVIASWYSLRAHFYFVTVLVTLVFITKVPQVDFLVQVPWHGNDILLAGVILLFALTLNLARKNNALLFLSSLLALQLHTIVLPLVIAVWVLRLIFQNTNIVSVPESLVSFLAHRRSQGLMWILVFAVSAPSLFYISRYGFSAIAAAALPHNQFSALASTSLFERLWANSSLFNLQLNLIFQVGLLFFLALSAWAVFRLRESRLLAFYALLISFSPFALLLVLTCFGIEPSFYLFGPYLPFFICGVSILFSIGTEALPNKMTLWFKWSVSLVAIALFLFKLSPPVSSVSPSLKLSKEIASCLHEIPILPKDRLIVSGDDYHFRNSFLYYLGPDFYPRMNGARAFLELEGMQVSRANSGYFVALRDTDPNLPKKFSRAWKLVEEKEASCPRETRVFAISRKNP